MHEKLITKLKDVIEKSENRLSEVFHHWIIYILILVD